MLLHVPHMLYKALSKPSGIFEAKASGMPSLLSLDSSIFSALFELRSMAMDAAAAAAAAQRALTMLRQAAL
jgi:hypothetical protein